MATTTARPPAVKELVAMLIAKPGQYNYATAGVGSGAHVSTEKFNVAAGVKAVHVPLKGTPPILTETMGGRVSAHSPGPGQGSTFTLELPAAA